MGEPRLILSLIASALCTCICLFAAVGISTRLMSCGGAAMADGRTQPGRLVCALAEPPITSATEAACVAFEHLEGELRGVADGYEHSTFQSGRAWEVLIRPSDPAISGRDWTLRVSVESGAVTEVAAHR